MKVVSRLILICLLFSSTWSFGQNVTITGKAPDYSGKFISIVLTKDYISLKEEVSAKSLIDENGDFEVAFETDQTIKCALRIGNISANIYIEPNKKYDVTFPLPPASAPKTMSNSVYVPLEINSGKTGDLNSLISEFNIFRDDFMMKNLNYFKGSAYRKLKTEIEQFKIDSEQKFGGKGVPYFKDYLKYSIAELELARNKKRNELLNEYIKPHRLSHNNNQYMNFFSQFYYQRFTTLVLYNDDLLNAINIDENLEKVNKALEKEPGYTTPKLREAALLYGLFEARHDPNLMKNGILKVLQSIADNGLTLTHQNIATNVIEAISKNMKGTMAPNFELEDENGDLVSLKDFRGKYVYIDFWATWCVPCLREMKMMKSLHEKHGEDVVFLSISTTDTPEQLSEFLKKNDYNWEFLLIGNNEAIKEDYDVVSMPLYYLINPSGNFVQSPARRPSQGIDITFKKLFEPEEDPISR